MAVSLLALVLPPARRADTVVQVALAALVVWEALSVVRPVTIYGAGRDLTTARELVLALPVLAVAALLAPGRRARWWRWAFPGASIATIRSSPAPVIDVWYFSQHAARCMTHGCNPYVMHTPKPAGLPGTFPFVTEGYPYLPVTFLVEAPFRAVFGDVRHALAFAIGLGAWLLRRDDDRGTDLAPLLLCVPGIAFQVEQAWTESLLLPMLLGAAVLAPRRPGWSALLLGLALATTQHLWLLVSVAWWTLGRRTTPWFLLAPNELWQGTVKQFLDMAERVDALTVWVHVMPAARSALVAVGVVIMVVWLLVTAATLDVQVPPARARAELHDGDTGGHGAGAPNGHRRRARRRRLLRGHGADREAPARPRRGCRPGQPPVRRRVRRGVDSQARARLLAGAVATTR